MQRVAGRGETGGGALAPPVRLLALATLFLAACDSTAPSAVGDLVVTDGFGGADNLFGVRIETEEDYGCAEADLLLKVQSRRGLTIDVLGVEVPEVCTQPSGPVSGFAVVEAPPTDVTIRKDGETDRYVLICGIIGCSLYPESTPSFTRVVP